MEKRSKSTGRNCRRPLGIVRAKESLVKKNREKHKKKRQIVEKVPFCEGVLEGSRAFRRPTS